MKKHLKRYLLMPLLGVIVLISLYLLSAFCLGILSTSPKVKASKGRTSIFIKSNGLHTDFVLPISTVPFDLSKFQVSNSILRNTKFVAFGWGDKRFYLDTPTWDDLTFSATFNALFLPSPTLMHATFYRQTPQKTKQCKNLIINDKQLEILQKYITQTFQKDAQGKPIILKNKGYTQYDTFYKAHGVYSCLNTCNMWTNRGIKKMNIKTAIWSPFDLAILWHLDQRK